MRFSLILCAISLLFSGLAFSEDEVYQEGFLSIEEAQQSIELQDGYSLQLVLSDPTIEEPVAMAWDGNGALYVVEMRTYMQDIDATGEQEPKSRISKHVDTNGDGTYDKSTVFIDDLLLPRMVLPLDDRILVGVTNTLDLWTYRDTGSDGVADEKIKVFEGGPRGGNMEHQPSGLIWGLDNWIYLTYQSVRYRFIGGKFESEPLQRGGGQWGLTQDDAGRIYYSTAGGENPAFFFQQPPVYGMFDLNGQTSEDFRSVFPIAPVPDVQGGDKRIGEHGGLNNFTGIAGQGIYRGDRLPEELYGDLFIPEPVGRLIRRAKVERKDARTVLSNAYPGKEFARSRDVNFRPVGAETAPDGTMYFIDMHRGIIQQGNWVQEGSYLRPVVEKWGLDKNIGKGRIYRLVHESTELGPKPKMLNQSTVQLVAHLSHPNGWWRDTAQRMILLRPDANTAVADLMAAAINSENHLGRVHALWTLEGLNALTPELLVDKLKDEHPAVRVAAIRVSENFLRSDRHDVVDAVLALKNDTSMDVVKQLINTTNYIETKDKWLTSMRDDLLSKYKDKEFVKGLESNREKLAQERKRLAAQKKLNAEFAAQMNHGSEIYKQLCFACHGSDGKGTPMAGAEGVTLGPPLPKSPRVLGSGGNLVRTIMHGLKGELDGENYPGEMLALGANNDQWIADISTYVRNSFGNKGGRITGEFVAGIRKQHTDRKGAWTQPELEELEPPLLTNRSDWVLTASHGKGKLGGCVDGDIKSRYDTGTSQIPGMWFQVEFPERANINRVVLDSKHSKDDYPRGYQLQISEDGEDWSEPLVAGMGEGPVTDIVFPNVDTKFIKITQTGEVKGKYWSIHELQIYGKQKN